MYTPDPKVIPEAWPSTQGHLTKFFVALTNWSHDWDPSADAALDQYLGEIFEESGFARDPWEYVIGFVKQPTGCLRAFQMTDLRFSESAASLIARLHEPQLDDEEFASVRVELWAYWCRWMRTWENTSAPVSAS